MSDFLIRHLQEGDIPFIASTWLNSYYDSMPEWMKKVPSKHNYMTYNHPKVMSKLSKDNVLVACDPEDSDFIFGYCVFEGDLLHYMYIKPPYRKNGIRKVFLSTGFTEMTHYTPYSKCLGLVYNPYRW